MSATKQAHLAADVLKRNARLREIGCDLEGALQEAIDALADLGLSASDINEFVQDSLIATEWPEDKTPEP